MLFRHDITALAGRDLTEEEAIALNNHTLAVLHGHDPVLKLLDNRIQSFFRFACKYRPTSDTTTPATIIPKMRTGIYADKMMMTHEVLSMNRGRKSKKGDFVLAATKEASRLGFAFVGLDLIAAASKAQGVISLVCANYGQDILDRFLCATRRRACALSGSVET
jgi:hypothetical protein